MKTELECIPCALKQTIRAIRFSGRKDLGELVLKRAMVTLAKLDWSIPPMAIGFELFRNIREALETNDPYKAEKDKANKSADKLLSWVRDIVSSSEDMLDTVVRISIAGNVIDYGSHEGFDVRSTISMVLNMKLSIYNIELLKKRLERASSLMIFLDNAGEAVFDRYMLEVIRDNYDIERFVVVAKQEPMINDVTVEELDSIGFKRLGDVEYRGVPSSSIKEWVKFYPELKDWIKDVDVVIAKGQGNFELMNEISGIFFMFMVKCDVIARVIGAEKGSIVLAYSGNSLNA